MMMEEKISVATRHNKLIMIQRNKLVLMIRNILVSARHRKLV